MHYTRLLRHGDVNVAIHQRDRAMSRGEDHYAYNRDGSYLSVHQRLLKLHGKALLYKCVDCGERASQWSYDRKCPDERIDSKIGVPYSVDLDRYEPRCVPCHKRFDLLAINGPRLRTICPVCLNPVNLQGDGSVGSHRDGVGVRCIMVGRQPPPWDEGSTREAVGNRSGGVCEYCRRSRATEKHHRVSRGVGGRWTPGGVLDLCSSCHRTATNNPEWAYNLGVSLRSTQDPEMVPVVRDDLTTFQPSSFVTQPLPRPLRLSSDKRAAIEAGLREGASWRSIASRCGVARKTIRRIVEEARDSPPCLGGRDDQRKGAKARRVASDHT